MTIAETARSDPGPEGDAANSGTRTPWPCRLVLVPELRPMVTVGWEHSATFRAQCQRLAAARAIVVLDLLTSQQTSLADARMDVSADGVVVARARVSLNARTLELIAHELEHVLERIDGVNFTLEANRSRSLNYPSDSVVSLPGGAFETRRATEAGRRVAGEIHESTRVGR